SLIPRLGASYVIGEFRNLKIEAAAGTYYVPSRLSDVGSRIHGTLGVEVNPYFFNTGVGFDVARDYRNFIVSLGVDIVRALRAIQVIPKDPVPPLRGFFPKFDRSSADGLPA